MRIRSLKPGFWISDDIARIDEVCSLHYIGLWSYAQDNGVGRDDPRLLKAALYPLRSKVTVAEVIRRQRALVAARLIVQYQENGLRLFYIPAWDQHQRVANPGKCPHPRPSVPITSLYGDPNEAVASPSDANTAPLGIGVRSGEGEGEVELGCRSLEVGRECTSLRDAFEEAWTAYPARPNNSRTAAKRAWAARLKAGVSAQEMLDGVRRYAAFVLAEHTDPRFIKQASTFFGPDEHFRSDFTLPNQKIRVYQDDGISFTPEFLREYAKASGEAR